MRNLSRARPTPVAVWCGRPNASAMRAAGSTPSSSVPITARSGIRRENSRAWLSLNMMTEARTGFRAFNEGNRDVGREIDFVALRQALARGPPWSDALTDSLMPRAER